jgi:hypothetical protein
MPCPSGAGDGSYEKFTVLADTVGVSRSFLTSCRANAAAWPAKERKSVAWAVHRLLAARPDRFVLLGDFIDHCNRQRITPSHAALRIWLDALSEAPTPLGRPRVDPVSRCERMALALETDALARLVQRLEDVLRSRQLTSVA